MAKSKLCLNPDDQEEYVHTKLKNKRLKMDTNVIHLKNEKGQTQQSRILSGNKKGICAR